jgi:tRNA modification GTPase
MSQAEFKTIAAIATPPGYGGIGVIRISGNDALPIARSLLHNGISANFTPNLTKLHQLTNPQSSAVIDEALVTFFQAPHSFTGEDVIEFACHGSPFVLAEILRLLLERGAELAQPGEFSLRAFLNQKLDLTQAEAINDLIYAQTAQQAQLAARQLRGELSKQIQPIKEALLELIVWFESSVEFVEDDLDTLDIDHFQKQLHHIADQIDRLTATYHVGRLIHVGAKLALIGRPNVGKSSLFNALLGMERAIVTPQPGTTRDTVSEALSINGIPIRLIDTAGLREADDLVERIGVERTKTAIAEADLIVAVFSVESALSEQDFSLLQDFPIDLCVINKSDLGYDKHPQTLEAFVQKVPFLHLSALTGEGLSELREALYQLLTSSSSIRTEDAIITNARHYSALDNALSALRQAEHDLVSGFTEEIALASLHQALRQLGIVTGETFIGDIINQIFSTFCIGK